MVETAKKEKERREAGKKGTATTVTNADLARTKKTAAMVVVRESGKAKTEDEEIVAPGDKPRPSAVAAPSAVPAPQSAVEAASESALNYESKESRSHDRPGPGPRAGRAPGP